MKITLAKALKIKNKLIGELKESSAVLSSKNTIESGKEPIVDIVDEVIKYNAIQIKLIAIKSAISEMNATIQSEIFRQAELRTELSMWKRMMNESLNPMSGWGPSRDSVEYKSVIGYNQLKQIVDSLVDEIDRIQDKLDTYNHKKMIDIDM
jgi:myosin heavy subunit